MNYAIGIDLGGTNIKMVALTPEGQIIKRALDPTDDKPRAGWAERVRERLAHFQTEIGAPAAHTGLAAPGLAARDERSIACMQGRMERLQGLDWTEFLRSPRPVRVLNDAHAALIGEAWLGAAAGCRDVVLLTLGTGVGGAILSDGKLLRGHIGRAGHLGHICLEADKPQGITGAPGTLEEAIGNFTVSRRTGGRFDSTRALVDAHRAGDAFASEVWLRSVYLLACALASLVNAVDPEKIILGGGAVDAGDALFVPLREFMDKMEWRPGGHAVPIVRAQLGNIAGAIGAARHAMDANTPDAG
jgi:glucokinase